MYLSVLYSVGDGTESCGTHHLIFFGAGSSPSTQTLTYLWELKELIRWIRHKENFNSDNPRIPQA
jgi:hypothetical protein